MLMRERKTKDETYLLKTEFLKKLVLAEKISLSQRKKMLSSAKGAANETFALIMQICDSPQKKQCSSPKKRDI